LTPTFAVVPIYKKKIEMEKGFVQKELYTAGKNNGIY
jgi:hypothetical protein